jgi:capsular polysaccharide transport system permease protein
MREELRTAAGSTPSGRAKATTAQAGGRETVLAPLSEGIIARLIRGKGSGLPTGGADIQSSRVEQAPAPPLQALHKRRISPRPAGFEAPLSSEPNSKGPDQESWGSDGRGSQRRKHSLGFALFVVLPLCVVLLYMMAFARPQYTSTVAFTVRSMENAAMNDALTGFAQFAGGSRSTDALILAAFLESQTLLERLDGRLDLVRHYSAPFDYDPVFALAPSAMIEGRLTHWRRMLTVQADAASGLIELRVNAFSPEMAQLIARELLVESRALLNDLNADAQDSATMQAEADFEAARQRLIQARMALTEFRTESRIFDPNSDFEGRIGVLRHLQGQLAQALVEQDLQSFAQGEDSRDDAADAPRVIALRNRIAAERAQLVRAPDGERPDYPALLATHERLSADRDYAEAAFTAARTALDLAHGQAARRDLYLAVFVQPTLPERSDHARAVAIVGLTALFLSLIWAIGTMIRAAVHDRR